MLFHVRMNVNLPLSMPAEQAAQLKQTEKELAQRLQHEGKWRHLWRIAGQYANVSVFDVDSVDDCIICSPRCSVPLHADRRDAAVPASLVGARRRFLRDMP